MAQITVPVLAITDGWDIDQVKTISDCDDADAFLTEAIAEIEGQLLADRVDGFKRGIDWRTRATIALRMKRRALQQVAQRRGQINRAARGAEQAARVKSEHHRLLDIIKRDFPDQFAAAVQSLRSEAEAAHG